MEREREDTFRVVADAVVSEEQPSTYEKDPVAPPTSDEILAQDAITGIQFHVGKAMTKLVLKTLTAHPKAVDNRLSAAL